MRKNDCGLNPTIIEVSAVSLSLLLIVTLTIIIITQCLLMVRMRKSKDVKIRRNETYTEATNPTSIQNDVPVSTNEAYVLHKIAFTSTEPEYDIVR